MQKKGMGGKCLSQCKSTTNKVNKALKVVFVFVLLMFLALFVIVLLLLLLVVVVVVVGFGLDLVCWYDQVASAILAHYPRQKKKRHSSFAYKS